MSVFGGGGSGGNTINTESETVGLSFDNDTGKLSIVNSANESVIIPIVTNAITNPLSETLDCGANLVFNASELQVDGEVNCGTLTASQPTSAMNLMEFYVGDSQTQDPKNLRLAVKFDVSNNVEYVIEDNAALTINTVDSSVTIPELKAINIENGTYKFLNSSTTLTTALIAGDVVDKPIGRLVVNNTIDNQPYKFFSSRVYLDDGANGTPELNFLNAANYTHRLTGKVNDKSIRYYNFASSLEGYLFDTATNCPQLNVNGSTLSIQGYTPANNTAFTSLSSVTLPPPSSVNLAGGGLISSNPNTGTQTQPANRATCSVDIDLGQKDVWARMARLGAGNPTDTNPELVLYTPNNSQYFINSANGDRTIRTNNTFVGSSNVGYLLDSAVNKPSLNLTGQTLTLQAYDPSNQSAPITLSTVTIPTDTGQTLSLTQPSSLSISSGNTVDLSTLTGIGTKQTLSASGASTISISGGNSLDLSTLTGWNQSLSASGASTISISGGNTLDLSTLTEWNQPTSLNQDLNLNNRNLVNVNQINSKPFLPYQVASVPAGPGVGLNLNAGSNIIFNQTGSWFLAQQGQLYALFGNLFFNQSYSGSTRFGAGDWLAINISSISYTIGTQFWDLTNYQNNGNISYCIYFVGQGQFVTAKCEYFSAVSNPPGSTNVQWNVQKVIAFPSGNFDWQ